MALFVVENLAVESKERLVLLEIGVEVLVAPKRTSHDGADESQVVGTANVVCGDPEKS